PKGLAKLSSIQLSFSYRMEGSNVPGTSVKVGPDGSFVARGLRPGKATVYPFSLGFSPLEFTLLRLEHDGELQPDGITIGPVENITNVRVVLGYNALKIRGEVKIVNGTLPKNLRLYVRATRTVQQPMARYIPDAEVDQLGRFIMENLSAGEYELHVGPVPTPGSPIDPRIMRAFSQAGQKVTVSGDNQPAITITVDLNQQEGNQ
ncbi:MAG: hypothetical protein J2P31_16970, partial [Blastocatellia bacterium]|nr:hypothetical protein [Blastocatellia bacterium]